MTIARRVLKEYNVPYTEIFIDKDPNAQAKVLAWTGFQSVPTIVIAEKGEYLPYEDVDELPAGASPRGVDRGVMLTEARADELKVWLQKHGFIVES